MRTLNTLIVLIASSVLAVSLTAQTRDYDFDKDGKPVQVGGPGYGQTASAPADAKPAPPADDKKADEAKPAPPAQPAEVSKKEEKRKDEAPASTFNPTSLAPYLWGILLVMGIVMLVVVFARRRGKTSRPAGGHASGGPSGASAPPAGGGSTPPPASHTPSPGTARPVMSPAAAAAARASMTSSATVPAGGSHAAPPATPPPAVPAAGGHTPPPAPSAHPAVPPVTPPAAPAPATPPVTPAASAAPAAPVRSRRIIHPMIAILVLCGASMLRATDAYTVFPSAIPAGGSINAVVTGSNANTLTGCAVALPEAACSFVSVISPTQAMIKLSAGSNALGGRTEPIRGTLRLVFGSSAINLPNSVAVGTPEQVGVAMLAPHANPAMSDTTARTQASQALATARSANAGNRAVLARIAQLEAKLNATPVSPVSTQTDEQRNAVMVVAMVEALRKVGLIPTSSSVTGPVPPPQVVTASAPASTTATASVPAGGNTQMAEVLQKLGKIESAQNSQDKRIDGLVNQVSGLNSSVTSANETMVKGVGVIAGYTAKALRKKGDRCAMLADLRDIGFKVDNPQVAGCK